MFTRYDYIAGATLAQVIADIALLLTGTSAKASLSASCAQANTNIIATVAAGWSVWDAAAGTNAQVFRALNGDGTTYKYMYVGVTATTYDVRCYESWNATTHVGTNLSASSQPTSDSRFSSASGGTLFVGASTQYAHVLGFVGTTFGLCKSVMERTRLSAWDTIGNGVVPVIYSDGSWTFGPASANLIGMTGVTGNLTAPRSKSAAFADVTGNNAHYTQGTVFGSNFNGGLQQFARSPDASGVPQYIAVDIFATNASRGDLGGQLYGIKAVSNGGLSSDDVAIGAATYFYVSSSAQQTVAIAIPKF